MIVIYEVHIPSGASRYYFPHFSLTLRYPTRAQLVINHVKPHPALPSAMPCPAQSPFERLRSSALVERDGQNSREVLREIRAVATPMARNSFVAHLSMRRGGAAARRARASGYEPRKPVRREGAMRRSPSQTRANGLTGPSTTSFRAAVHLSAFAMSVRRYFLCSSSIDREPEICAST